jgi:hypothetical protein
MTNSAATAPIWNAVIAVTVIEFRPFWYLRPYMSVGIVIKKLSSEGANVLNNSAR